MPALREDVGPAAEQHQEQGELVLRRGRYVDGPWLCWRRRCLQRQVAALLFARAPQSIENPNASVRVFKVRGKERLTGARHNVQELPRIEGNIVQIIEQTHQVLFGQIQRSAKLHDLFFREVPEYPDFAWQEAIVNAVARRRVHASRNPRITRVATDLGVMREQGEGIPRMIEEMEASWLPVPEFSVDEREFVVLLCSTPIFETGDPDWTRALMGLDLHNRQKRILVARVADTFSNADYQQLNQVDRDVAYREIKQLVDARIVVPSDKKGKGATYRVPRSSLEELQPMSSPEAGSGQLIGWTEGCSVKDGSPTSTIVKSLRSPESPPRRH